MTTAMPDDVRSGRTATTVPAGRLPLPGKTGPAERLRILYHHRIAAADGMRVHVTEVVNALRSAGHEVLVVGPNDGGSELKAGAQSPLERVADAVRAILPPFAFELLELAYNSVAYARLAAAARTFQPDVIYERYNLFLLSGLTYARRHRLPLLLEVNSPLAEERAAFGRLQLRPIARRCEVALWRGADVVLPVTEVLAARVRAVRPAAREIHVIPNGADPSRRASAEAVRAVRDRLQLPDDALVLGFVGFIRAWHGVGWALDALPGLRDNVHLVVVGDGPAQAELRARAQALGVADRVHLMGRAPHEEIPAYMETFDVALQTAAVAYASPLKLFEYMALGRAIIAPDQPNMHEVLSDGQDALLFAPDDAAAFQSALHRLCDDAVLRKTLGANARHTLTARPLTWAENARRIAALSQRLRTARAGGCA